MSNTTSPARQEVLSILQGDWAEYIQGFRSLSPEAQSAFLSQQGYARFTDLLAHIVPGGSFTTRRLNDMRLIHLHSRWNMTWMPSMLGPSQKHPNWMTNR